MGMIRRQKGGIEWLEFEQLQNHPEVVHGVVLKSLDFRELATQERARKMFGISEMVPIHCEHGNRIEIVPHDALPKCDGSVTRVQNCGLVVTHADCQAALFYDPVERVIANVHCGWRGNVQNIYGKAVEKLRVDCGVDPQNLLVCISPSLGPEVAEFVNYLEEFPQAFFPFQVKPYYFDLWAIAQSQLEEAGVLSHHIEMARLCTYSGESDFFSYRRDKKTGRHGTVIAMKG